MDVLYWIKHARHGGLAIQSPPELAGTPAVWHGLSWAFYNHKCTWASWGSELCKQLPSSMRQMPETEVQNSGISGDLEAGKKRLQMFRHSVYINLQWVSMLIVIFQVRYFYLYLLVRKWRPTEFSDLPVSLESKRSGMGQTQGLPFPFSYHILFPWVQNLKTK